MESEIKAEIQRKERDAIERGVSCRFVEGRKEGRALSGR